ncbi:MAG: DUF2971 domain-containing protein [Parcubacteria group bacterium]|nr:DUF2971 domain-containing protein [Parcubacteria group bacterium]
MKKQTYYHFLSAKDAIDDLKKERIRVSRLNTLNDPFEMMPYRRYKSKERKPYNKVFRQISKKWGLLCFCPSWKEQLLWAHYARGHRGIALGFKITKDKILKLTYTPNEIRTKFDLTDSKEENERKFLSLAEVKYQEWIYEKEHRILLKLEECEKDSDYYMPFGDRFELKEIVLGCKFDHKKQKENILKLKNKLHVEVRATRPGWEDYRIHECGTTTDQYK